MLKDKRGAGAKAPIYRHFGIAPQTYNAWEADMYIPGDEYAERLADYLGVGETEMVWLLYSARKAHSAMGGLLSSFLLDVA